MRKLFLKKTSQKVNFWKYVFRKEKNGISGSDSYDRPDVLNESLDWSEYNLKQL